MFDHDIVVPMSGNKSMRLSDYMGGGGEYSKYNMVRGERRGGRKRRKKQKYLQLYSSSRYHKRTEVSSSPKREKLLVMFGFVKQICYVILVPLLFINSPSLLFNSF